MFLDKYRQDNRSNIKHLSRLLLAVLFQTENRNALLLPSTEERYQSNDEVKVTAFVRRDCILLRGICFGLFGTLSNPRGFKVDFHSIARSTSKTGRKYGGTLVR